VADFNLLLLVVLVNLLGVVLVVLVVSVVAPPPHPLHQQHNQLQEGKKTVRKRPYQRSTAEIQKRICLLQKTFKQMENFEV
jgi:hypothetical protein